MGTDPTVSIIVTIVQGGDYVREFLQSIADLENPPPLDVIVPYDTSVADLLACQANFPWVTFIDIGTVVPARPITTQAGQHELYDRRRAAGLAAARGDIISILEDRGRPQKDWARVLVQLHAGGGKNVIGGAIDCREPVSTLNWALYVTDLGRYGRPFATAPADWVSDVNISYSRQALEQTRHLWQDRYHEPVVHWFLKARGEALWLDNRLVVHHIRPPLRLGHVLPERFDWGRLFGEIRVRGVTPAKRLLMIASGPLIPPVLWLRHFRVQAAKGRGGRYLRALPYVMVLTTVWTMGEVWGYITRRS